jgi:glycosyltransferase involved in cell wall biosynthesis
VLIPTIDRYPYLRVVLNQLRAQTAPVREIIVVDQTPIERRDPQIANEYRDLPLVVIGLDTAGQCTSRNAGLARARGDHILFLDDDVEIKPDLVARHLAHLQRTNADVSSGVAQEPTTGALPEAFTRARASDVFPTHNTLTRRVSLERSGLFDLAYDHGSRADGDLGMRVYLAGMVMLLDPAISVLHHHAPRGGLRTHGARVITYGGSRRRITHRSLPDVTELYRALRYFSDRQVREVVVQAAVGTLSAHGGAVRKLLKAAYGLLVMPDTLVRLRRRLSEARGMLDRYPQIPVLPPRNR